MLLRNKVIAAGFAGALIVNAVGIGVAHAAYPRQPIYKVRGGTIGTPFSAEYLGMGRTRLWVVSQTADTSPPKFVITCTSAENATGSLHNTLEANGLGKAQLTLTGCAAYKVSLNENNKFEEAGRFANCTVKQAEDVAGFISTNPLKTRLVWNETADVPNRKIIDLIEAENTLHIAFSINILGNNCPLLGAYELAGGALAFLPVPIPYGAENSQIPLDFGTINQASMLEPFYKNWIVELASVTERGVARLTFNKTNCPTIMLPAVLSGMIGVEVARVMDTRYNLGVSE